MSFTIANTNHPELIDRFKCITRDEAIYPTSNISISLPEIGNVLYIKMDIRTQKPGGYYDDSYPVIVNDCHLMKIGYNCDSFFTTPLYTGNFQVNTTEWHTYFFAVKDKYMDLYVDGVYKGNYEITLRDNIVTVGFAKNIWYRNIIISNKQFSVGAIPIEVPIDSITGWDHSGENSYAADEDGQTCSISLNEAKLNELKENYDISRLVCTGVIDRQGEKLNSLGIMYGEEKKNVSIDNGEHPFSVDNIFDENNIIHLIAKKV